MNKLAPNTRYRDLLARISSTYAAGRSRAAQAVNTCLVQTYWQVANILWNSSKVAKTAPITARV